MLRINLLRHLPTPEAPAPQAPRSGAGKRLLKVLAALTLIALIAGAAWFFLYSPYFAGLSGLKETRSEPPAAQEPPPVAADSARLALEALAAAEIAAQQSAAVRLSSALESFLPGALPSVSRAVLSPPADFVLRGEAASQEALSRIQETLVLVPGLDLARSESRDKKNARGLEFIFAGRISAESSPAWETADTAGSGDSLNSTTPDHATDGAVVIPLLDAAALDRAWAAFLENAAAAGVEFTVLPAGAPTASGSLRAHPYRVQATCSPLLLREFLAGAAVQGSPFGIRRITWEINSGSQLVSLDIMAFSR